MNRGKPGVPPIFFSLGRNFAECRARPCFCHMVFIFLMSVLPCRSCALLGGLAIRSDWTLPHHLTGGVRFLQAVWLKSASVCFFVFFFMATWWENLNVAASCVCPMCKGGFLCVGSGGLVLSMCLLITKDTLSLDEPVSYFLQYWNLLKM